jgi:hypothetical protein
MFGVTRGSRTLAYRFTVYDANHYTIVTIVWSTRQDLNLRKVVLQTTASPFCHGYIVGAE